MKQMNLTMKYVEENLTELIVFPKALQDTWAKIYAEWFPTSGYELTGGPELLWNESPDTSKPDYRSEIWIPVKKAL